MHSVIFVVGVRKVFLCHTNFCNSL